MDRNYEHYNIFDKQMSKQVKQWALSKICLDKNFTKSKTSQSIWLLSLCPCWKEEKKEDGIKIYKMYLHMLQ
jgi:hypothetical protein